MILLPSKTPVIRGKTTRNRYEGWSYPGSMGDGDVLDLLFWFSGEDDISEDQTRS